MIINITQFLNLFFMKKGMFFALAASSLLFSACSSDDAVVSTVGQNEAVQQIVLQVASSGDGLSTRAGRPGHCK